jgi:DNA-binding LytR/AlgR family response regulator
MGMLKAIVVDDELPAREELICMLEELEGIGVVAAFEDGEETMEFLKMEKQVDVVFLDVQMRRKDGITTAGEILQLDSQPYIVFVTGFGEYAVKAFELDAVDYIVKPYDHERLRKTVAKLQELKIRHQLANDHVQDFISRNVQTPAKLSVWAHDRMIILQPGDIYFAKIDAKGKTMIISTKGDFWTKFTLKELAEKLAMGRFFRTHKSFLVNLDQVEEVILWYNSTFMLKLAGQKEAQVPVARHYIKEFNKVFERI